MAKFDQIHLAARYWLYNQQNERTTAQSKFRQRGERTERKKEMNREINLDDFLDEPSNEEEARVRRTTSGSYTLSEVLVATKRKTKSDSNDENKKKPNATRENQKRKNRRETVGSVDVEEIKNYAKDILERNNREGEVTWGPFTNYICISWHFLTTYPLSLNFLCSKLHVFLTTYPPQVQT